jgi:hypothetical protein
MVPLQLSYLDLRSIQAGDNPLFSLPDKRFLGQFKIRLKRFKFPNRLPASFGLAGKAV